VREGGLRYANLAVRGRLLDQMVEQIPAALALRLISSRSTPAPTTCCARAPKHLELVNVVPAAGDDCVADDGSAGG